MTAQIYPIQRTCPVIVNKKMYDGSVFQDELAHNSLQSIKFVDNNTVGTNNSVIWKNVGELTSYVYASFYVLAKNTTGVFSCMLQNDTLGTTAVNVGFLGTNYFYYNSDDGWKFPSTYLTDHWYHFEILYNIESQWFSFYIDNTPIGQQVQTAYKYYSITQIRFCTGESLGSSNYIFYLDDVTVRDWYIKNQRNISSIIDDPFEDYANNSELEATPWNLFASGASTNVTIQTDPLFSHSHSHSVRMYDGTEFEYCHLNYFFDGSPHTDETC